jgi:3'-phosphoadenosine 5'-phosphosulfate sulfotransferase (PAPS reductase)/FAD synthetase
MFSKECNKKEISDKSKESFNNNNNIQISVYHQKLEFFRNNYTQIDPAFFNKIIDFTKCFENLLINQCTQKTKLYVSFNGGKDCLAAYILIKYFFYCKVNELIVEEISSFESFINSKTQIKISDFNIIFIYFVNDKNFKEEEDYVINFAKEEGVEIFYLYSDYITGLKYLIQNFDLKLVIMGTRKDDLIKYKSPTKGVDETLTHHSTAPYPDFVRFYPIFKFDFDDIWRLIILSKTNYLELYDRGFSSIGNRFNTSINENLKIDENLILPAWCLQDSVSERSFRK